MMPVMERCKPLASCLPMQVERAPREEWTRSVATLMTEKCARSLVLSQVELVATAALPWAL